MIAARWEALRVVSGLVVLGLLPESLGRGGKWRLFGSWSILLQSEELTRLPQDIDIQLSSGGPTAPTVLDEWRRSSGPFELRSGRARAVTFSDPRTSPNASWQTVDLLHRGEVVAEEAINWVWPASVDDRDIEALHARDDAWIDLRLTPAFSVAAYALPEIADLPLARVRAASREECIAQKWTRIAMIRTGARRHTRWQDLADVYDLVLGESASLNSSRLVDWLRERAGARGLGWPILLSEPPSEWLDVWDSYNFRSGVSRPRPADCTRELNAFLRDLA
ncbi:hypothetical protein [Antiquaquibacter soli]|uniref:Nucleotidyl transferase AbiEii/AbiGii toxin family protein n=1 Tax=Antiquaquibacter soli TaxID=3064523 RepID=A0ABT9BSQ3_9MICO|nr:hypothetical protein [Protaetiibacter sp. WY-16]MDO7883433.1 hypothetical protein [Protaetiibacter sp. WY-16]